MSMLPESSGRNVRM